MSRIEVLTMGPEEFFRRSIELSIRSAVNTIIAEETEAAIARVRQRMGDEVGRLALRVFQEYEVSRRGDRLVIEVKLGGETEKPGQVDS